MSSDRRSACVTLAAIALLAGSAYAAVWRYAYVQDAVQAVQLNPVVARADWREIFTSDYWKDTTAPTHTLYRPVTVLSFALERRLCGRSVPAVSHLVNVALHVLTAFALFLLARSLGIGPFGARSAALLFSVHPLLLQAVANVVGRSDLLVALFGIGALSCWVRLRPPAGPGAGSRSRDRVRAWGGAGLAFLALGSKESGVAVPFLLVAAELTARGPRPHGAREWGARLASFLPSVLAGLVYLHLRTVAIGEFPGQQPVAPEDNALVGLTRGPRIATALAMAGRYAAQIVWPARLSPDYSGTTIPVEPTLFAPWPLGGLLTLVILASIALWPWIRRSGGERARAASIGAWMYLLTYAVVGNLLVLNAAGFAERMAYFPAAGALLLAGVVVDLALAVPTDSARSVARYALAGLVAAGVVAGAWHTRSSVPMWRSGRALFEQARQATPRSLRAALAHAARLEQEGRLTEALEAWTHAAEIAPAYGGAWMSTGIVLARLGRVEEAEAALRRAIALDPAVGEPYLHLGRVLASLGRNVEAERAFRRALLLDPGLVEAAAQLAHVWFVAARYADAARLYGQCVERGREDLRPRWREAAARALDQRRPGG